MNLQSSAVQKELQEAEKDTKEALQNVDKVDYVELETALTELKEIDKDKYNQIIEQLNSKQVSSSGRMETNGDILITYDNKTSRWRHGHDAIVRNNNNYIVERC